MIEGVKLKPLEWETEGVVCPKAIVKVCHMQCQVLWVMFMIRPDASKHSHWLNVDFGEGEDYAIEFPTYPDAKLGAEIELKKIVCAIFDRFSRT